MKKIAICVPTYKRPEIIEELIIRQGKIFERLGCEVYLCDSSDDDKTYEIYNSLRESYSNLKYEKFSSEIHSNLKVYRIFQNEKLQTEYDYIWIYSDVLRFSENALISILESLDASYDIVIPNARDIDNIGTKEYCDCAQMFREIGWHMTLYGATIVNTQSILKEVDWDYYEKKYCNLNTINFSHMCFLLETMALMEKCKVLHLSINGHEYSSSPLRKKSAWYKETFILWIEYWPSAISLLPTIYDKYKAEVIKKECIYSNIFTKGNLVELKNRGIYNWNVFIQYKSKWNMVTNIGTLQLAKMAVFPVRIKITKQELEMKKRLIALKKAGKTIYIYGAGMMASIIAEHLEEWGIDYKGYLVTDKSVEKDIFNDHEVSEFTSQLWNKNIAIIIATNEKYEKEIWNHIDGNKNYKSIVKGYWK